MVVGREVAGVGSDSLVELAELVVDAKDEGLVEAGTTPTVVKAVGVPVRLINGR